jgi:hypothetical protein
MSQHEQLTRTFTDDSAEFGSEIANDFYQTAAVPGVHEYNGGVYYTVPNATPDSSSESDNDTESEISFDEELGSPSEQSGDAAKKSVFRMHRFKFLAAFLVLLGLSAMTYFLVARNKSSSVDEKAQSGQPLGKASSIAGSISDQVGLMPNPDLTIQSNVEAITENTKTSPKNEVEEEDVDPIPGGVGEGIKTQVETIAETMQKPPATSRKQQVVDFVKKHKTKIFGGAAGTAAVIAYLLNRGDRAEDNFSLNAITDTCDWENHALPHCSTSEAWDNLEPKQDQYPERHYPAAYDETEFVDANPEEYPDYKSESSLTWEDVKKQLPNMRDFGKYIPSIGGPVAESPDYNGPTVEIVRDYNGPIPEFPDYNSRP